jgi:hypothetical protein
LLELLRKLWEEGQLKVIIGHVVLNVVFAVAAALFTKDPDDKFALKRLGEFLGSKFLPFFIAYVAAYLIGASAGLDWLATATFAIIEATLAADLVDSLGRLGIPIPEAVKRLVSGATAKG